MTTDKIKAEIKRLRRVLKDAARVAKEDGDNGYYYDAAYNYSRADKLEFALGRLKELLGGK